MESAEEIHGWLQGLAGTGCTFVEVPPGTKHPKKKLDAYRHQVGQLGLSSALRWLGEGMGLGILPRSPLWILDADSREEVERIVSVLLDAHIAPLMVRTPSGGAHFYFILPDGFPIQGLKAHVLHPLDADGVVMAADFKFGPDTLLVAPGSMRKGRQYEPSSPWRTPPVADPRMFLPGGAFWFAPPRTFLVNTRPLHDRLAAARYYLGRKAPVSVSGKHGHRTLAGVASHLVVFLDLSPAMAASLLVSGPSPWNCRCTNPDGSPYPWSASELRTACDAAVGTVPAAGVKAFERQEEGKRLKVGLGAFIAVLKESLTLPDTKRVPVARVGRTFRWFGQSGFTPKRLGVELSSHGVKRKMATHARIQSIPALDYLAMVDRLLVLKRAEMAKAGHSGVCSWIPLPQSITTPNKARILSTFIDDENCNKPGRPEQATQ